MSEQADLLPGTLDLLNLKAVSLGDVHGYRVYRLIRSGRRRLGEEEASWNRLAEVMARILAVTPQEA